MNWPLCLRKSEMMDTRGDTDNFEVPLPKIKTTRLLYRRLRKKATQSDLSAFRPAKNDYLSPNMPPRLVTAGRRFV